VASAFFGVLFGGASLLVCIGSKPLAPGCEGAWQTRERLAAHSKSCWHGLGCCVAGEGAPEGSGLQLQQRELQR
jgi:hypothetical protein